MSVRTFNPQDVVITIAGVPMSGYADGTFLLIDRDEDAFTKVTGADGTSTRVKSNNRGATMTLTLKQSSPSNDILSALANADDLSGEGVFPILVKDLSGNSIYFSATGWVQKLPASEFGKEINNREWIFDLVDTDIFVGSNAQSA